MTPEQHKAETLRHCLQMALTDPEYAIWAAGVYEKGQPWLMANLQAKVRQEIKRSRSSASDSGSGAA